MDDATDHPPGQRPRVRWQSALIASVVLALSLAGCTDASLQSGAEADGGGSAEGAAVKGRLVTERQLQRERANSPERALLTWWQRFQLNDDQAVVDMTTEETLQDVGESALREMVRKPGAWLPRMKIVTGQMHSGTASIEVELISSDPQPDGEGDADSPHSFFTMYRVGGEWKFFDDTEFLPSLFDAAGVS